MLMSIVTFMHDAMFACLSGDLHAAVYDFGNNIMYVGMAGAPILANGTAVLGGMPPLLHNSLMYSLMHSCIATPHTGVVAPAYSRPWFKLDMNALFAQPPPQ
jgi:hypothetical protein